MTCNMAGPLGTCLLCSMVVHGQDCMHAADEVRQFVAGMRSLMR
jgi:hypothetical protein